MKVILQTKPLNTCVAVWLDTEICITCRDLSLNTSFENESLKLADEIVHLNWGYIPSPSYIAELLELFPYYTDAFRISHTDTPIETLIATIETFFKGTGYSIKTTKVNNSILLEFSDAIVIPCFWYLDSNDAGNWYAVQFNGNGKVFGGRGKDSYDNAEKYAAMENELIFGYRVVAYWGESVRKAKQTTLYDFQSLRDLVTLDFQDPNEITMLGEFTTEGLGAYNYSVYRKKHG